MKYSKQLYIPGIEPRLKHATVFKTFDALQEGETLCITNDHDPKPLYYQFVAERGTQFSWRYLQNGPEEWQVEIKKNKAGITVGELAAADLRKAAVFKKWGIDFCCGGRKTLQQACEEARLDRTVIEAELADAGTQPAVAPVFDFNRWAPDFLADYIYNQHHQYYYENGPVIADLLQKVTAHHGNHFPELQQLNPLYQQLQQELQLHFSKEERVLFPFIKALVKAKAENDDSALAAYPAMSEPVAMMEADHDAAGGILLQIRAATNNYTPPAGGCNSFQLLYQKLHALEGDLHQHIHLENNLLFPKALLLEKELQKASL